MISEASVTFKNISGNLIFEEIEDMAERKSKTSTEAKTRYNSKTYDVISVRVPKEMAAAFKQKCLETGAPQAQIVKNAITDFLNTKENTHDHSIVAIKDTFNEYPNRFLLYYDARWKCYLFPNFKDNADNESFIKEGISNKLKVKADGIDMMFLTRKRQQKYSESHKENRTYLHSVYKATIKKFPTAERTDEFEVDGVKYRWMSIPEMESDDRIQKVNSDVVQLVKECCN
jgi:predicted DNA-binding protein